MNILPRIVSMTVIFAVLAGPGGLPNWLLGAALAAPLAFAIGTTPPALSGRMFAMLLLPWFILGIALRTTTGTAQTIGLLLRRDWSSVGLMTCPAAAETRQGRDLLALAETISPGSIVISAEDEVRLSAIDADAPEQRCRKLGAWYARFQRPMAR